MSVGPSASCGAVVLAGGNSRRFGAGDKLSVEVDGRPVLGRVLDALRAVRASPIVVVGPHRPGIDSAGCTLVRESPAGGGPLAGLTAGLRSLGAADAPPPFAFVVAGDLPYLTAAALAALREELGAEAGADAALAVDDDGRLQHLLGLWRVDALRAGLAAVGDPADRPMHSLVDRAEIRAVSFPAPPGGQPPWQDLDVPTGAGPAPDTAGS